MRMGAPAELAVSNDDRVLQALAASDLRTAAEYIALQYESNATMMAIYIQWPCAYLLSAAESLGEAAALALATAAFAHWSKAVQSIADQGETESRVVSLAAPLLHPDLLTPAFARGIINAFNSGQSPDYLANAMKMLNEFEARLSTSLAQGNAQEARQAYEAYFSCARSWHDVLMQYADSFPGVAAAMHGQASAEAMVEKSFSVAPFSPIAGRFPARPYPRPLFRTVAQRRSNATRIRQPLRADLRPLRQRWRHAPPPGISTGQTAGGHTGHLRPGRRSPALLHALRHQCPDGHRQPRHRRGKAG